MENIGLSLVLDGVEVASWNGAPGRIEYRNGKGLHLRLEAPTLGDYKGLDGNTYTLASRLRVPRPTKFHSAGAETVAFDGVSTVVDANYVPMSITDARDQLKAQVKQTAKQALSSTDWMVVRQAEDSTLPIPPATIAARQAARQHSNALEAEIDALNTLTDLDAWVET
jgi:hypothetical protein